MGFDSGGLLKEAGYTEGEFVPIGPTFSYGKEASVSVASDTYTFTFVHIEHTFRPNAYFSPDTDIHVVFATNADTNGDQLDIRLRGPEDSKTILEETGITQSGERVIGPQQYEPNDRSQTQTVILQLRNADNSTTVSVSLSSVAFGVVP